ncbi:hypothetical protein V5799_014904 [Amblyomma americanum]|uniref:THAP-type domain-containing protein n=1 Tax=Amblyomma americanum TaxID=6943 RepID=A0AAQ4E1N9_AMBAM
MARKSHPAEDPTTQPHSSDGTQFAVRHGSLRWTTVLWISEPDLQKNRRSLLLSHGSPALLKERLRRSGSLLSDPSLSSIAAAVSSGSLAFCACDYMGPRPKNKNCCVVGCNSKYSNSPGVKFFSFPSRPWERERRQRWIQLVRRQNEDGTGWLPSKNSRICSKHFVGNVKANEVGHPSYHPSIFPSVYKRKQTPGSSRRFERHLQ